MARKYNFPNNCKKRNQKRGKIAKCCDELEEIFTQEINPSRLKLPETPDTCIEELLSGRRTIVSAQPVTKTKGYTIVIVFVPGVS